MEKKVELSTEECNKCRDEKINMPTNFISPKLISGKIIKNNSPTTPIV